MTTSRISAAARVVTLTALAFGCGGPTAPSAVTVLPSSSSFSVGDYAIFTVRNGARETIYVDRCGEHVQAGLDRRVGLVWENEMAAICILSFYVPPLALAPGESVADSVLVRNPGTYRLFVGYGRGDDRILYQARSGGFVVK